MPKRVSSEQRKQQPRRRPTQSNLPHKYNSFLCRICKRPHPLRFCRKFLGMNVTDRIRVVRDSKYCSNCLAHDHSQGTCFTKHGCRTCQKFHHSLLHINPRILKKSSQSSAQFRSNSSSSIPTTARSESPPSTSKNSRALSPPSTSKKACTKANSPTPAASKLSSLTAILRQNTVILLPTVLVKLGSKNSHARCLLDSGSAMSRISKRLVEKLDLTTLTMCDETICPLVIKSRFDSNSKIEGTFRVDNRLTLKTPIESLDETFKKNFKDLFLADSKFYESAGIDIVIGVDLYPKVICEGVISKIGLPTAQSTIFGWTIYGACSI